MNIIFFFLVVRVQQISPSKIEFLADYTFPSMIFHSLSLHLNFVTEVRV